MSHRHHKQKRAKRIEWMILQEIAKAEKLLDQNAEAAAVLTKQLDNEPRVLKQAFAEIEQEGGKL